MPTDRDPSKHEYSLVAIVAGAHRYPARIVGQWTREQTGEQRSLDAALEMLAEDTTVERVHVYHSHPSPGPVGRFLGVVTRVTSELIYA